MPVKKKAGAKVSARTKRLQKLDALHHIHPFTQTELLNREGVRVITRAKGIYVWDSEGHKLIDGMAGLWCVQVGYGNKELARAGAEALRTLPYYNHFFKTTNPWTVELAAKLATLLPEGHSRVLFANSGSEANDAALKLIRYYWNLKGRPEKKIHLSRAALLSRRDDGGGVAVGADPDASAMGSAASGLRQGAHALLVRREGRRATATSARTSSASGSRTRPKQSIREIGPDRIASFSAEPVQGAGGLIIPPKTYWPEMARICRRTTFFCMRMKWSRASAAPGNGSGASPTTFEPDILTMAKGLSSGYQPISAVSLGARMGEAIADADEELVHGYTYSGHPVASAVALKNLEVLERKRIVQRVKRSIGPYFQRRVREVFADHPLVGEVRGIGLLAAIELVEDKKERRRFPRERNVGTICRDHCFSNGLVMRAIRDTMVLSPPLVITEAEVEKLLAKAKLCIDLTAADLGVAVALRRARMDFRLMLRFMPSLSAS